MLKVLNIGCGTNYLISTNKREFVNMDILPQQESKENIKYIQHNLLIEPWPLPNNEFDEIYMFHTIEHIPEEQQPIIFREVRRVINDSGRIVFSYPEFLKCVENYKTNKGGQRDFWKATIYGRGLTEWDRHKSLMDTNFFMEQLMLYGLQTIKSYPEKNADYNTVLLCRRSTPTLSYEKLMAEEFSGVSS